MPLPLISLPHVPLSFVKEPKSTYVHYTLSSLLHPVCTCPCVGPAQRRKAGDTLCRCPCHAQGKRHAVALCGLVPLHAWGVVATRRPPKAPLCQTCHQRACAIQMKKPDAPFDGPMPVPTVMCKAKCAWIPGGAICGRDVGHEGLHSMTNARGGKVAW